MAPLAGIDWLGLVGDNFVKSSWALLIAILLAGLARRHSASLRHFILSLFLVGLVFLPLISVLPSGLELRWLPSWLDARMASPTRIEPAAIEGYLLPDEPSGLLKSVPLADDDSHAARKTASFADIAPPNSGRAVGLGLILVWLTGLFVLLLRLALGILGALRLTREGETLDDSAWQRLLERFLSAVSIKRKVGLKSHWKVAIPLTWGLRRPVVIMPAGAASWDEEERSTALFHELSHVKRADYLVMLLVRMSLALFWFNPLTWIAFKMLKSEQEKACDELALRAGIRPSAYAAGLISIKRSAGFPGYSSAAVLGMSGRSQLNDRLLVILRQKLAFKEVKMKTKIMISAVAFLAVSLIGLARPTGASNPENVEPVIPEASIVAVDDPAPDSIVQETEATQEKQEKKQTEKAAEPKEGKEKLKAGIAIESKTKETSEGPVEITIIEGNSKKTIRVDEPIIMIKNDEAEKKIVVLSGGKEVLVVEGGEIRLKIKGDKTVFLKSAEPLKLKKGLVIRPTGKQEAGEEQIIVKGKPYVEIVKEAVEPRHITLLIESKGGKDRTITIIRPHVEIELGVPVEQHVEVEPHVAVEPHVEIEPAVPVEQHVEVEPHVAVEPHAELEPNIAIEPYVHAHKIVTEALQQEKLRKVIAETQALLKQIEETGLDKAKLEAQKETLRELKESLKNLQQELEKEKEGLKKAIRLKIDEPEKSFSVVLREPHAKLASTVKLLEEGKESYITIIDDKGTSTFVFKGKVGENQQEAYEKAVDMVRKGLPEGYELESEFHEKTGTFVIKIKGRDTSKESRELVKRLIKSLKEELKK